MLQGNGEKSPQITCQSPLAGGRTPSPVKTLNLGTPPKIPFSPFIIIYLEATKRKEERVNDAGGAFMCSTFTTSSHSV